MKNYDIPEIEVFVLGGLVQDVKIPKGTNAKVVVKDYDISDYATEEDLDTMQEDEHGKFHEAIYESEDE